MRNAALPVLGLLGLGLLSASKSRRNMFERWPVTLDGVLGLGHSAGVRRPGHTPEIHQGLDLFAPAETPVVAPDPLRIVRVIDGTTAPRGDSRWRAGLYVEGAARGDRTLRFLHLRPGSVTVKPGDKLRAGDKIGEVAARGESGNVNSDPHLHFEVREGGSTGPWLDPLRFLPPSGNAALDRAIALRLQRSQEARA